MKRLACLLACLSLLTCGQMLAAPATAAADRVVLHDGWALQSACKVNAGGDAISSKSFKTQGWYRTSVPSTVLAAQVASGEYRDVFTGMNLRKLPGMTYPIGKIFSSLPMAKDSPYACGWWYRTSFQAPRSFTGRTVSLHFAGINYRANIWLNGRKIADAQDVAGAYRQFEFDVTASLRPGENVLAVETFAPTENDLAISWVDWNPAPPDKNLGLWGDVTLTASGPVTVRYPQVVTHLPQDNPQKADLTVRAEVQNHSTQSVQGVAEAVLQGFRLRQDVSLSPGETRSISFTPEQYPELRIKQPKLWWPREMGEPTLHPLTVRFLAGKDVSDQQQIRYGIREITSELTDKGHRLFRINGKPILIRGGGWAPDMLLRYSKERVEAEFRYVMAMNLNTIRLEGKLEPDHFFDLADEKGIMVMAGWCCCDAWEKWSKWQPETLPIATESLRSQSLRLRSHPSVLVWLYGSDYHPTENVERAYLDVLQKTAWPNPTLSSASAAPSTVTGRSGVKMTGPYDYVPPSYWLTDKRYGGAYGFNTETSPGPAIPVAQSLTRILPKEHLWPQDEVWGYHTGGSRFQQMDAFNSGMKATYGEPKGWADYTVKAQAMAYDGERAMFEAYARNKYTSTGVVQWMLNNAWPSMIWHLYDYYLQPGGGYFGTKKANEPLHVQYSYDDRSVVVVNSRREPAEHLSVEANLYDFNLKPLFSQRVDAAVEADGITTALTLPALPAEPASAVYFVKLVLRDGTGKLISDNFYWLPATPSVMAWDKTKDTAYTPAEKYEDMTMLNRLPSVELQAKARTAKGKDGETVEVTVRNPSKTLAFQVRLSVRQGEQEILPVLWDDNYFALMPGESRVVKANFSGVSVPAKAELFVEGWNIKSVRVSLVSHARTTKAPATASRRQ